MMKSAACFMMSLPTSVLPVKAHCRARERGGQVTEPQALPEKDWQVLQDGCRQLLQAVDVTEGFVPVTSLIRFRARPGCVLGGAWGTAAGKK